MSATSGSDATTVTDFFLNGALRVVQPRTGYRAATDPVLLAAAVPIRPGARVLDLGTGVGTAALCLGRRVDCVLHGLEVQPEYADLARLNAAANDIPLHVTTGDLRRMPADLKAQRFDAVMLNPPYHAPDDLGSPDAARDRANRLDMTLAEWLGADMRRLVPGGWIVVIQRVERLPELLAGLDGTGDIAVLPLVARQGRAAKRVIVKARKTSRGPFRLMSPLVLHAGTHHDRDRDDFTQAATAILRDGGALDF